MAQKRRCGSHAHGRTFPTALLNRSAQKNKEIAEIRALIADMRRMKSTLINDKHHPDSSSYDAIKTRRLYILPGISQQCADTIIRSLKPRVEETNGLTIY